MYRDVIVTLPVIPLRDVVVLPNEVVHCDAGRRKTVAAMQAAAAKEGLAFFCLQRDARKNDLTIEDMYTVGTVCRIKQIFKINGEGLHILVTGIARARVETFTELEPYFTAEIQYLDEDPVDSVAIEALRRRISEHFEEYAKLLGRLTSDQKKSILATEDASVFIDTVAFHTLTRVEDKQKILETSNILERAVLLVGLLHKELEVLRIDKEISKQVAQQIDQNQREYYLREQLKAVHKELGDDLAEETQAYYERMQQKTLPDTVKKRLEKEIKRLETMPVGSHESPMQRNYIECILDLPWSEQSEDCLDLTHARQILDEDHYAMEEIKDRMIEFLAVQKLTGEPGTQILCLVGPPGVGKTSIAASIARAMGRQFVRMSLGGVRDEAEIRGHRRTYIGAMPGRVIQAMRQAGTINPVLLFDEIDKLSSDVHGDPAAAMLEVLDSAQNNAFCDHYLELPYDLSKAVLLTTANNVDTIARPLLDRMELLEVPSYLANEKLEIAKRHLLPKQMQVNGLKKSNLRMGDIQLMNVIESYTREAGVRELERVLGKICRKAACEISEGKERVTVSNVKVQQYLGQPKYKTETALLQDAVGVATGLAWTAVGGETLLIEAVAVAGNGSIKLTGQLGDVMQESGQAAMTYVRANCERFGLKEDFYSNLDIHIHVPQGAVPKDGPSAGVTMTTALVSALTGVPVKGGVAMTGELTLRGRVLPIGGLREKLFAAVRAGMDTVLLPAENKADLDEVAQSVKDALHIIFVETLDDVIFHALTYQFPNSIPKVPVLSERMVSAIQ